MDDQLIFFSTDRNTVSTVCECFFCQYIGHYISVNYFSKFSDIITQNTIVTFQLITNVTKRAITLNKHFGVLSLSDICMQVITEKGLTQDEISSLEIPIILKNELICFQQKIKYRKEYKSSFVEKDVMKLPLLLRHHIGHNIILI